MKVDFITARKVIKITMKFIGKNGHETVRQVVRPIMHCHLRDRKFTRTSKTALLFLVTLYRCISLRLVTPGTQQKRGSFLRFAARGQRKTGFPV